MATFIPESVMRLRGDAIVNNAELSALGRGNIIREGMRNLAESALQKLMNDCIKTQDYMGYKGNHLHLDVCVVEPGELLRMLAEARREGERDAQRWNPANWTKPQEGENP